MNVETCIPSLATVFDYPLSGCIDTLNSADASSTKKTAYYVGGMIAYPISIILTPVAIVADIVSGVVQAVFVAITISFSKAATIAWKKVVVAPIQQVLTCATKAILLPAIVFWPIPYLTSKRAVSLLPNSLNRNTINTFVANDFDSSSAPSESKPSDKKAPQAHSCKYAAYYDEEHKNNRPTKPPPQPDYHSTSFNEEYEDYKCANEEFKKEYAKKHFPNPNRYKAYYDEEHKYARPKEPPKESSWEDFKDFEGFLDQNAYNKDRAKYNRARDEYKKEWAKTHFPDPNRYKPYYDPAYEHSRPFMEPNAPNWNDYFYWDYSCDWEQWEKDRAEYEKAYSAYETRRAAERAAEERRAREARAGYDRGREERERRAREAFDSGEEERRARRAREARRAQEARERREAEEKREQEARRTEDARRAEEAKRKMEAKEAEIKEYKKLFGYPENIDEKLLSKRELTKTFRKLVPSYHPDHPEKGGSNERFKFLKAAYDYLMEKAEKP